MLTRAQCPSGDSSRDRNTRETGSKGRFVRWEITEPRAERPHLLNTLGPLTIKFVIELNRPIRAGHHGIALRNVDNQLMWAWATNDVELEAGSHEFRYTFPMLPVRPGPYKWHVSLYDDGHLIDAWECLPEMIVATEIYQHSRDEWNGVLNVPCKFEVLEGVKIEQ